MRCFAPILVAGGIQLLRIGGQAQSVKELAIGQSGKAGDVTVVLASSSASDGQIVATVRIGGTDDPNGLDGFKLVGPGKVAAVTSATCAGITVQTVDCSLTFTTAGMAGTSRQLHLPPRRSTAALGARHRSVGATVAPENSVHASAHIDGH